MTHIIARSRLAALAALLTTGTALTLDANVAAARSGGSQQHIGTMTRSASPQFVVSGQPAGVKRVLSDRTEGRKRKMYDEGHRYSEKKKKACANIVVPTAACGVSRNDPVGNTRPGMLKPIKTPMAGSNAAVSGTSGATVAAAPAPAPAKSAGSNTVTVSNGVTQVTLPNTPLGLMISSNTAGTITVSNGFTSQTLKGGEVTLSGVGIASGVVTTQTVGGLQTLRPTNGDMAIAPQTSLSLSSRFSTVSDSWPICRRSCVPPGIPAARNRSRSARGPCFSCRTPRRWRMPSRTSGIGSWRHSF